MTAHSPLTKIASQHYSPIGATVNIEHANKIGANGMALDKLEVIGKLKLGLRPAEVAKIFDCAESTVEKIEAEAAEKGLIRSGGSMSHDERRKYRKQIADWVKANGATIADAVAHFNESSNRIREACRENGVEPTFDGRGHRKAKKATQTKIIAMLIDGIEPGEVAKQLGVTRQYVSLCRKVGEAGGIFAAVERAVKRGPAGRAKIVGLKIKR